MTTPLVSVLIPAYRAAATIAATLESVLAQTWPSLEILVVDDGSPDETLAVARRFEGRGVRVLTQSNAGAAAARNHAFRESQGRFVQFLDADDLLSPGKIEAQVRRLMAEPPDTVASAAWARFRSDPSEADFRLQPDWRDFEPAREWLVQSWNGRGTMFPAAWLLPRGVAEAAGPWDERLSLNDDGEYNARVLTAARKIVFCPDARAYYRSGSGSNLSARRDASAMTSARLACELSVETMLQAADLPETRQACANLWQFLAFEAFPEYPEIVRDAETHVARLGGASIRVGVSRPFRVVRDVIGWKPARQLHIAWNRLRYEGRA